MWSSLAEMPRNTVGPPRDSVVMAWSGLIVSARCVIKTIGCSPMLHCTSGIEDSC